MYFIKLVIDFQIKKKEKSKMSLYQVDKIYITSLLNRSRRNIVKNKLCWTRTLNKKKSVVVNKKMAS